MSYRSFEEVWQDITRLQDKDVFTLCRRKKNHILKVDEKGVLRYSDAGRGTCTLVDKARFERVWTNLVQHREFVPKGKGGWLTCACIAHLPEVEYSCKDGTLRLYLRQQNTHPFCEVKEWKRVKKYGAKEISGNLGVKEMRR